MGYMLEQLAADIHDTLVSDPGSAGKAKVCGYVSRALKDQSFVASYLKDRPAGGNPREILYEDPQLGFCICGHVYSGQAIGSPHDHGASWAIYGEATGVTEMTEWTIVEKGGDGKPSLVEPARTYDMNPGDVQFYDIGVVHSPKRLAPVKLIRIEGKNLDQVKRSNIKAK